MQNLDDLLRILRDPLLWDPLVWEAPLVPDDAEIAAILREADAERERAKALCDSLLTGSSRTWKARFSGSPETRTLAVVQQLLERVPALRERRAQDAFHATSIAVAIAEALDSTKYPPDHVELVRGFALWEHASVLAYLGQVREALRFAGQAERTFAQIDTTGFELDGLAQLKATLLARMKAEG